MFTPIEHRVLFETRPLSISSYRHTALILWYQQQIIVLLLVKKRNYSTLKVPLCRGWQTLSHIIVINLWTGGLIEREQSWEAGVVVFVILYYSSFIFYFDVVCEIVLFWSHLKPLTGGEEETVERSDDLSWTLTSPHWCQRSTLQFVSGTLNTDSAIHTHTHTHIHGIIKVWLLYFWGLIDPVRYLVQGLNTENNAIHYSSL